MRLEHFAIGIMLLSVFMIGASFIGGRSHKPCMSEYVIEQGDRKFETDVITYDEGGAIRFHDKITGENVIVAGTYCIYEHKTQERK